jgi:hypothetical protein
MQAMDAVCMIIEKRFFERGDCGNFLSFLKFIRVLQGEGALRDEKVFSIFGWIPDCPALLGAGDMDGARHGRVS